MKKAALITGASDRIGKAIAMFLAQSGYAIAIHYNRSAAKAEETASLLRNTYQVECLTFQADFNQPEQVNALVPEIQKYMDVQVLVNNASLFYENTFPDADDSDFDRFFAANFRAPYALTRAIGRLKPQNRLVINMLDADVTRNETAYFDYLLTKKFLHVFTPMAAFHLAPEVRVNAIAPGYLLPPKEDGKITGEKGQSYLDALAAKVPLQKQGKQEDITGALDYFLNNEFITGQVIFADGGMNLL